MASNPSWREDPRLWLELFVLANLAFLGPDIYLAHSINRFRHPAEFVPLYFSLASPLLLLVGLIGWRMAGWERAWRATGHLIGWTSAAVGVVGLVLHLESRFFHERTLASLVYCAPFVAPLAYTGIGLLLILNRMVDAQSVEWPMWVLLLALGGFAGNFILSLADHAQNGFFHATEWLPVISSALAVGFLAVPFVTRVSRRYLWPCVVVLLLQAVVGVLGFVLHNAANLRGPSPEMWDNLVWGAPVLAPLLFPNLVLLAFIALWVLRRHLPDVSVSRSTPAGAASR